MALIVGIYERLVEAITKFNLDFLKLCFSGKWRAAFTHIDGAFLIPLGLGIVSGYALFASAMHTLLEERPVEAFSVFFGIIAASSVLVALEVKRWPVGTLLLLLLGAAGAYFLTGPFSGRSILPVSEEQLESSWYYFASGAIAICAMILPGVSGSYLLVLLDKYQWTTGTVKSLLKGEAASGDLVKLAILAVGCATGILLFARVLKWVLKRYHQATFAFMAGFMIGSLRRLWPFKSAPEVGSDELMPGANRLPGGLDEALLPFGLMASAALATLILDYLARRVSWKEST